MSLIPREEINVLRPASEVKAVAETALDEIELAAVATLINTAGNNSQLSAVYQDALRPATKKALEAKNYKLKDLGRAKAGWSTLISWE